MFADRACGAAQFPSIDHPRTDCAVLKKSTLGVLRAHMSNGFALGGTSWPNLPYASALPRWSQPSGDFEGICPKPKEVRVRSRGS
jgi:hypothetical protein